MVIDANFTNVALNKPVTASPVFTGDGGLGWNYAAEQVSSCLSTAARASL